MVVLVHLVMKCTIRCIARLNLIITVSYCMVLCHHMVAVPVNRLKVVFINKESLYRVNARPGGGIVHISACLTPLMGQIMKKQWDALLVSNIELFSRIKSLFLFQILVNLVMKHMIEFIIPLFYR